VAAILITDEKWVLHTFAVWGEMQWQVPELNAGPCEGCECSGGWQQVPEAALRSVRAYKPAQGGPVAERGDQCYCVNVLGAAVVLQRAPKREWVVRTQ
jgi:hypothetical protein